MSDMLEKRSSSNRTGAVLACSADTDMCVIGEPKGAADAQPQSGLDEFMSLKGEANLLRPALMVLPMRHYVPGRGSYLDGAQSNLLINSVCLRALDRKNTI